MSIFRKGIVLTAIASGASLLLGATPALAHDGSVTGGCAAAVYQVDGYAYFAHVDAFHLWYEAGAIIQGPVGNKNNIHMHFSENGRNVGSVYSDDNVRPYEWFVRNPHIYTFEATDERVEWRAYFDTPGTDPRCSGWSQPI